MIRFFALLLCICMLLFPSYFYVNTTWAGTMEDEGGLMAVSASTNAFALDLYKRIIIPNDNLFFSPYSICAVFAMVYGGARGNTATQM